MTDENKDVKTSDIENGPLVYKGMVYPSFPTFQQKGVEAHLQIIQNLESRKQDIIVCAYPKSGTHWTLEVTKLLINPSQKLPDTIMGQTFLEFTENLLITQSDPRLFSTHLLWKYLPQDHMKLGGRIIHVMRNPKDVCASAYNHFKKDKMVKDIKSWDDCFEKFLTGELPFGGWYNHLKDYEELKQKYPNQVHEIWYENMKENPKEEIKRLAVFLNLPCTDNQAEIVEKLTHFDHMKANKVDLLYDKESKEGGIYRKGVVGDWKNWFTVSQNERFNAQYQKQMKPNEYKTHCDKYV